MTGISAMNDHDQHPPERSGRRASAPSQAVPNSKASAPPGVAKYGDLMYVVYQYAGQLWYSTLDLKEKFTAEFPPKWTQPVQVTPGKVGVMGTPALVEFQGKLYVAYQGSDNKGGLWYRTYDGEKWSSDAQIPGVTLSESPALAVYQQTLYVTYQGSSRTNALGSLWYKTSGDGTDWPGSDIKLTGVQMSGSPSLAVCKGRLYWAHQGSGNNGQLWYLSYLSNASVSTWYPDAPIANIALSGSPALGGFEPDPGDTEPRGMVVFYRSNDGSGSLRYATSSDPADNRWEGDGGPSGPTLSGSPAVAVCDSYGYSGKGGMWAFCAFRMSDQSIAVYTIDFE